MPTSGATTRNFDVNEILQEAWERATGGQDLRSGYQLRTARRSLELLLLEWANKGLNLFTVEPLEVPLVAGTATYDLPVDTVDLIEHVVRSGVGTSQRDNTLVRISVSTYATLTYKNNVAFPSQIYVNRQAQPTITLYPIPDNDYTLIAWRLRRIQDAGTGSNVMDMPFRFIPALIAGTAYHIALKLPEGMARLPMLQDYYQREWMDAADEDRDRASVKLIPGVR